MIYKFSKAFSCLLVVLLIATSFQCDRVGNGTIDFMSKSFIVEYYSVRCLIMSRNPENELEFVCHTSYKDPNCSLISNTELFDSLAAKHNDTTYNRIVTEPDIPGMVFTSACNPVGNAEDFVAINVVSDHDWDEQHPAGTSLNDIVSLSTRSYRQYIKSGYDDALFPAKKKYTYQNILLSEMTAADYELIMSYDERYSFTFKSRPTLDMDHMVTFTFVLDDGRTFYGKCRMPFTDQPG